MKQLSLKKVIDEISRQMECEVVGERDVMLAGVTSDSRKVKPGFVFVAVKGVRADGHAFVPDALKAGAAAVVVNRDSRIKSLEVPLIIVPDSREALVVLLKTFLGDHPEKIYAVTGTNGKTTTTHILWEIFSSAGEKAGIIGTLGYILEDGTRVKLPTTTPGAESLWEIFSIMRQRGITSVAMEASSHGIDQKRVWGIRFNAAIFTNLTQDHLDYHGDMESYLDAKCRLFEWQLPDSVSVVNIDDPTSAEIIRRNCGKLITYSLNDPSADVYSRPIRMDFDGSEFVMHTPWGEFKVKTHLPGRFNMYNLTAAAAATLATGYSPEAVLEGLSRFRGAKGRFQRIELGQPFEVIIDYAHTPDALKNLIQTAKEIAKGRVIVVFGAGGDRDPKKRPIMGEIATSLADFAVITSDNPRTEDPEKIIDMIIEGVVGDNYIRITDRKRAIFESVNMAKPGDVVLIAGKGHEDYQILGDKVIHFDDAEVAEEAIRQKMRRDKEM